MVGWRYLAAIQGEPELAGIELLLCDANSERVDRARERFSLERGFTDLDQLLEHGLDGLLNLTPTRFHADVTRAALGRGIHVFSEKPFAGSAAEGRELLDLAEAQRVTLIAAPAMSATHAWDAVRRRINAGEIGAPRQLRARFGAPPWPWVGFDGDPSWYLGEDTGPLRDLGIYGLDLAVDLFGEATDVSAFMRTAIPTRRIVAGPRTGSDVETRCPDAILVCLEFADRRFATVEASYCVHGSDAPTVEVFGEWGTLTFDPYGRTPAVEVGRVSDYGEPIEWSAVTDASDRPFVPEDSGGKFAAGVRDLVASAIDGRPRYLNGHRACHLLEIIDRAYESARHTLTPSISLDPMETG